MNCECGKKFKELAYTSIAWMFLFERMSRLIFVARPGPGPSHTGD